MNRIIIISFSLLSLFLLTAFAINVPQLEEKKSNYFVNIYKGIEQEEIKFLTRNDINTIFSEQHISLYEDITRDKYIAETIIKYSLEFDVPINLAFSIAFIESSFNPRAYNKNTASSIDRGLFQLNSLYRRDWSIEDFYNIEKNVIEGISYFKHCLELSEEDVVKALAAYNGGPRMINREVLPQQSKLYVDKVLQYEDELNIKFNEELL